MITAVKLSGYPHQVSTICRMGCVRDALQHAGLALTAGMAFGLSNGLDFGYRLPHDMQPSPDFIPITGMGYSTLEDLADNLGVKSQAVTPRSDEEKWEHIHSLIASGIPVLLDVVFSEYVSELHTTGVAGSPPGSGAAPAHSANWDKFMARMQTPLGMHMVALVGLDEPANQAQIVESQLGQPQTVPLDRLKVASDPPYDCLFHPHGRYYVWRLTDSPRPLAEAIRRAIPATVRAIRRGPTPHTGIPALRAFVHDLPYWPELCPPEVVENTIYLMYYISELIGGGGMYRRHYARFLQEAAAVMQDDRLAKLGFTYHGLAQKWRLLVRTLLDGAAHPAAAAQEPRVRALAHEILAGELAAVNELERIPADWGWAP